MEYRVLVVGPEGSIGRDHFADRYALKRPSMRGCHRLDLLVRFGKGDMQHRFAAPCSLEQELERERSLAGPRRTFDEVQPVGDEPAFQDIVETFDSGRGAAV